MQPTASGPLRGNDTDRRGKGGNEVVNQKGVDWEKAKARGAETESESESESGTDMEEEEARNSDSGESGSSGAEWRGASVNQWEANANY